MTKRVSNVKIESEVDYTLKFKDGTEETKTYKTREDALAEAKSKGAEAVCGTVRFIVQ